MTSTTAALELPAPASEAIEDTPRSQPPVRPWVEFLVVGGATLLLFPIAWALRGVVGLDTSELVFGFTFFHAARVLNDPHFAVTYILFYRDARARPPACRSLPAAPVAIRLWLRRSELRPEGAEDS